MAIMKSILIKRVYNKTSVYTNRHTHIYVKHKIVVTAEETQIW